MAKRLLIPTVLALGVIMTLFAGTASADYEPGGSQVLGSSSGPPGSSVSVSGTGCPAGSTVTTTFGSTVVGTTVASPTGTFDLTIVVPADTDPGTYTITSTCGDVELTSSFTVTGADEGVVTPPTTLARTGSNHLAVLTQAGLVLAATGGILLVFARKRRTVTA
ncbi:MAG: hypothetical protein JWM05_2412 [Acidimicrobiales bacterium]|nr:hypothetical protein [Acidimicrobiales bacterium]